MTTIVATKGNDTKTKDVPDNLSSAELEQHAIALLQTLYGTLDTLTAQNPLDCVSLIGCHDKRHSTLNQGCYETSHTRSLGLYHDWA